MKTVELEEAQASFDACVDAAQSESLLVTRDGAPAVLVIGVQGRDIEDLRLEADPAFWAMIEERRRQPTLSRAELDDYLRRRDEGREGSAEADPAGG